MILDHCPSKPRLAQRDILLAVEQHWDQCSVFVIQAAVALGKSFIAYTISKWVEREKKLTTAITTPTNILVDQYEDSFSDLVSLRKSSAYGTKTAFGVAQERAKRAPVSLSTYYAYAANKLWKDVLIGDEAHSIISMIQDRWAGRLWQRDWWYPDELNTIGDVVRWMESKDNSKLNKLRKEIVEDRTYTLQYVDEFWRGEKQPCIKLIPLSVRDRRPWLWGNKKVRKIVLMSATINAQDVYELGLDKRRVVYIEADSPIPAVNRLIYYEPVVDMRFALRSTSVTELVARLHRDLEELPGKGVIHCSYDVAARLKYRLRHDRLIWHTRDDKVAQYRKFRESDPGCGAVLVASGLSEGIDLVGDAGRWQVLTQVMFPDINDPAVAHKAAASPEWYAWQAIRTMLQTVGRICRTPTDMGVTKVYDSQFSRLYSEYPEMFPQHVRNSIVFCT